MKLGARGVSRSVKALSLCVAVLAPATLAAAVEPARACSCIPPEPWSYLEKADGAFVGRLVSRTESGNGRAVLLFSVERAVKGKIGDTVAVETVSSGAACGIETSVGRRIGLFLMREGEGWFGHLCWQVEPEDLLAAAALPSPNGSGPVALFVGGRFGAARTLALDAKGRTLAYGMGAGYVEKYSVCPGGRRVAELVTAKPSAWTSYTVAIRELPSLRLIRQQPLKSKQWMGDPFRCMDASGEQLVVFMSDPDLPRRARLVRFTPPRATTIWRGIASYGSLGSRVAFVQVPRRNGETVVTVSLRNGAVEKLGTVPVHGVYQLVPNPGGTRLAGHSSEDPRLLVIDLSRRPISVRTIADPTDFGDILWLQDDRFAYFGNNYSGADSQILVYSAALRLRARVSGWKPGDMPALVGFTAYGVSVKGPLVSAKLPSGRLRVVRRLPGEAYTIASATR